jgi:hypothetical protein
LAYPNDRRRARGLEGKMNGPKRPGAGAFTSVQNRE